MNTSIPEFSIQIKDQIIKTFESIVVETISTLPNEFSKKIENVEVLIEEWPTYEETQSIKAHPGSLLFGLYRGVPKTKRLSNYSSLPDKIIIFAGPILTISKSWEEAKMKVRNTVLHEIGHHFGLSDDEIYAAQDYRRD